MDARTRDVFEAALQAKSYRDFLGSTFAVYGRHSRDGRFNHSTFARKAGLKSRGFAQEVVSGRKRLTSQSLPKFEKALALPVRANVVFKLLVLKDEPEVNEEELSAHEINERLESARARIRSELKLGDNEEPKISRGVFRHRHVLTVYATLGNQRDGVSFEDIARRTKLQPALIRRVLAHLVETKVATELDGRYRSINPLLVFQGLGGDHPVRDSYLDTMTELQKVAKDHFSDADKTFIHSHVSIDPKRLAEFKKRLWKVVLEFIDECDNDDGEAVAKFLVGFYV